MELPCAKSILIAKPCQRKTGFMERLRTKALPRSARGLTLFTTKRTRKPVIYETVKQQFKKAAERAGVKDATLHDLRAKPITDAKKQGHDPQKLAGHSDSRMTNDTSGCAKSTSLRAPPWSRSQPTNGSPGRKSIRQKCPIK